MLTGKSETLLTKKKPIRIKPSHEGIFSAKAKAAGKSVAEYAREKQHASGALGKQARFALHIGERK